MNEVIRALNKPGIDALFELLENNNGSVPTGYFHHAEEDMRYAMKQPWVSIGSDGTAVTETDRSQRGIRIHATLGRFRACLAGKCARKS
jgi:hypothetical protein